MDTRRLLTRARTTALIVGALIGSACTTQPKPSASNQDLAASPAMNGSSFNEVLQLLRSKPYDPTSLPLRVTSIDDIRSPEMLRDAGRTLDSNADILPPFRRLLHPNGLCLAGEWVIEKENPYSGLFKAGSRFPLIARLSPPNEVVEPHRFRAMSVGLVGKVFPAQDRDARVQTANFITQTDIGGYISSKSKILYPDLVMTNAPDVTAINRGHGVPALALQAGVLDRVDVMTTERPLYPLAEAHKSGEATKTPKFMKLTLQPGLETPGDGSGQDMRLEVWQHIAQKGPLVYDITVSDHGKTVGPEFLRKSFVHWDTAPIGKLVFTEALLSQACDDQILFHHPAWRDDLNDPKSSVRAKNGAAFGQPLVANQVAIGGEIMSPRPVSRVFSDLNDVTVWPAWMPDGLVSAATAGSEDGFYNVTFNFGSRTVRSLCQRDALDNAAVSLRCRGATETAPFLTRPIEQDLTFVLTGLPDGKTRISWGLLLRSEKGSEVRNALQDRIQNGLAQHFDAL